MKNENGITLIALIITIIVMLILVGVTINVALNGGLFDKAKTASIQTQREADKEHLLSLITGTLNDTGNLQLNETNLSKEGWQAEISSENTDYFECTSPKGTILYVNKDTGKILDELPDEEIIIGAKTLSLTPAALNLSGTDSTGTITVASEGAFSGNITWTVSPSGVVTVDGNNQSATVTAVANGGTATITASWDREEASCTVTVTENPWITRGLTSSNVVYDEIYVYSNQGAALAVYSDGSLNLNGTRITSEQVQGTISGGNAYVGSYYFLLMTGGNDYLAYEFNDDNTITVYSNTNSVPFTYDGITETATQTLTFTISE